MGLFVCIGKGDDRRSSSSSGYGDDDGHAPNHRDAHAFAHHRAQESAPACIGSGADSALAQEVGVLGSWRRAEFGCGDDGSEEAFFVEAWRIGNAASRVYLPARGPAESATGQGWDGGGPGLRARRAARSQADYHLGSHGGFVVEAEIAPHGGCFGSCDCDVLYPHHAPLLRSAFQFSLSMFT